MTHHQPNPFRDPLCSSQLLRCVPEELNALEVIAKEGSSKVIENLRMQDVDIWAIKDEEGDNLLLKAIKSGGEAK